MKRRIYGCLGEQESIPISSIAPDQLIKDMQILNQHTNDYCNLFSAGKSGSFEINDDIFVACDGYISNIKELSSKYFFGICKTNHFLKKLYHQNPKNWFNEIRGEYAISIYDKKSRELTLIRDINGARPMYYFQNNQKFYYGSEIKFIKMLSGQKLEINSQKIAKFLCQFRDNINETFFHNLYSLKPGEIIKIKGNKYQKIQKIISSQKNDYSFSKAKAILHKTLTDSIRKTNLSNKKMGCLVSGGIDSASVYSLAKQNFDPKLLKSISMRFFDSNGKRLDCDEGLFQELIVDKENHLEISFQNTSPFKNVDNWVRRFDQPFLLPNAYLYEHIYKECKKDGIELIIDGNGGDSVFSHGWERFKELFKFSSIITYWKEISLFETKHDYKEYTRASLFKKFTVALLKENPFFRFLFKIKNQGKKQKQRIKIVSKNVLEEINFIESYDFSRNFRPHKEKIFNPIVEASCSSLDILFYEYNIEQKSPLLDEGLIKLNLSFPSKYKLKNGESRYILRETMKKDLPSKILRRFSKSNLSESFRTGISEKDIRNIEREINDIHPTFKNIISKAALKSEFTKLRSGNFSESTLMNIWNFYIVSRWLRTNEF